MVFFRIVYQISKSYSTVIQSSSFKLLFSVFYLKCCLLLISRYSYRLISFACALLKEIAKTMNLLSLGWFWLNTVNIGKTLWRQKLHAGKTNCNYVCEILFPWWINKVFLPATCQTEDHLRYVSAAEVEPSRRWGDVSNRQHMSKHWPVAHSALHVKACPKWEVRASQVPYCARQAAFPPRKWQLGRAVHNACHSNTWYCLLSSFAKSHV